ncbi:MAG: glycosyltransferase [Pseudomonadota bacterium]
MNLPRNPLALPTAPVEPQVSQMERSPSKGPQAFAPAPPSRTAPRAPSVMVEQTAPPAAMLGAGQPERRSTRVVDLAQEPPDPALFRTEEIGAYIATSMVPWRRIGRVTTYAIADPADLPAALARLSVRPELACVVVAPRAQIEAAIGEAGAEPLAWRASHRLPEALSVRGLRGLRHRAGLWMAGLLAAAVIGGEIALCIGLTVLFLLNAATMALRVLAMTAGRVRADAPPTEAISLDARRPLPMISLLVPLYREGAMAGELIRALTAIAYPRDRLEVRLLLEADDIDTARALAERQLPAWITPMVVPPGQPRTKPRALNYALDFCRGEIIGILDAEDRPDPHQLRAVARRLGSAPQTVACCQCQLSYHNWRDTWLSRCFQLEYAIWFEVLLRGWQALRLPIPLGGTSVYFRRTALEAAGGWDAHNVTEDADLGMRLARMGYRTTVLRSVTEEEATCHMLRWIRQRSRWLKGYLLTWASHMRRPGQLWRELGPRGFLGLNILFLGSAAAYLAIPLFWAAVLGWSVTGGALWQGALPDWAVWPAGTTLALGQAVMLACATMAMVRRRTLGLIPWVLTLPLYWTLGAVAAWKAVLEIVIAPFWWDKTRHGTSPSLRRARRRRRQR